MRKLALVCAALVALGMAALAGAAARYTIFPIRVGHVARLSNTSVYCSAFVLPPGGWDGGTTFICGRRVKSSSQNGYGIPIAYSGSAYNVFVGTWGVRVNKGSVYNQVFECSVFRPKGAQCK